MGRAQQLAPPPAHEQGVGSTPIAEIFGRLKFAKDKYPRHDGMVINGETKVVAWQFPDKLKTLEIVQVTDMQWGHRCCQTHRVIEYRDWVLSAPNRFMVWTGDNVDAATMISKGTTWENLGD